MVILKEDFYNNKTFSRYDFFKIGDRTSKYKLSIGEYSGTAGKITLFLDSKNKFICEYRINLFCSMHKTQTRIKLKSKSKILLM